MTFKIKQSPVRSDSEKPSVYVSGKSITINGFEYDFSPLNDGDTLPAGSVECDLIVGDVECMSGVISITIMVPNGANASHEARFPSDIIIDNGPVEFPE